MPRSSWPRRPRVQACFPGPPKVRLEPEAVRSRRSAAFSMAAHAEPGRGGKSQLQGPLERRARGRDLERHRRRGGRPFVGARSTRRLVRQLGGAAPGAHPFAQGGGEGGCLGVLRGTSRRGQDPGEQHGQGAQGVEIGPRVSREAKAITLATSRVRALDPATPKGAYDSRATAPSGRVAEGGRGMIRGTGVRSIAFVGAFVLGPRGRGRGGDAALGQEPGRARSSAGRAVLRLPLQRGVRTL